MSDKKIVHICLTGIYADKYTYQDNLLTKYHAKLGYTVEIIATTDSYSDKGGICYVAPSIYYNENAIKVTRLANISDHRVSKILRRYNGLTEVLESASPDIIFVHGCQFLDILKVVSYAKNHKDVVIYVDNHADFVNSARNWLSRYIKHGVLWKYCAKKIEPYTTKFYGVSPARVDFLHDVYGIPYEKIELLVMGADDDAINSTATDETRKIIRNQYNIADGDILILTAGKIDYNKPEVINLMQAIKVLNRSNLKLLVFGSVSEKLKKSFYSMFDGVNVIYGGWLKAEDTYKCFNSANLIAFPGLHSVYWEQAVGCGCACVFRKIKGFEHIDVGGNCEFFENVDTEGIKKTILKIIDTPRCLENMKRVAIENGKRKFSYSEIAKRSIGE